MTYRYKKEWLQGDELVCKDSDVRELERYIKQLQAMIMKMKNLACDKCDSDGYCDRLRGCTVVREGFDLCYKIIYPGSLNNGQWSSKF